jgi:hypothetical protein
MLMNNISGYTSEEIASLESIMTIDTDYSVGNEGIGSFTKARVNNVKDCFGDKVRNIKEGAPGGP